MFTVQKIPIIFQSVCLLTWMVFELVSGILVVKNYLDLLEYTNILQIVVVDNLQCINQAILYSMLAYCLLRMSVTETSKRNQNKRPLESQGVGLLVYTSVA